MNYIADRLFALLLGWTNSLFNGLWNLLTNNTAGVTGFLKRFWLPIILVLLIAGTLIDYIIWFIRWRPHYVWGAWLRQRGDKRRLDQSLHYMEALDYSPLDLPEYQQEYGDSNQPAVADEPVYFDFDMPWTQDARQEAPMESQAIDPAVSDTQPPLFVPNLPWEGQQPGIAPQQEQAGQAWFPASDYSGQPDNLYMQPEPAPYHDAPLYPEELPPSWQPAAPANGNHPSEASQMSRRRRVDSRRQRGARVLQSIRDTFFAGEDELASLDSIQPPVTQEEAFHKPYYPQNYSYKEQQAPTPPPPEQNTQP